MTCNFILSFFQRYDLIIIYWLEKVLYLWFCIKLTMCMFYFLISKGDGSFCFLFCYRPIEIPPQQPCHGLLSHHRQPIVLADGQVTRWSPMGEEAHGVAFLLGGGRWSISALAGIGRHGQGRDVPVGNRPCIAGIPCGGRQAHALSCRPWYNSHWHRCHKAGQYIMKSVRSVFALYLTDFTVA